MFINIIKKWKISLSVCTIESVCESLVSNSKGPIKCLTLNDRPCPARATLVNINSNKILFCPFTVSVNKCGGSCNDIDDPYARVCVQNKVNVNVKVFDLISRVDETIFLVQHEPCECKNRKKEW